MRLIDASTAESYLRTTPLVSHDEPLAVRELAGGVSNMVLLVERQARPNDRFVIKQARAQLRTAEPWFSSVERIWREAEVLSECTRLLSAASSNAATIRAQTPRILFEDRANYLFAMTAAPEPNRVWKQDLLAGNAERMIAVACGWLLGTLHAGGWRDQNLATRLGDRTLFDQLRVDPYYRTLAAVRGDAQPAIEDLIDSLEAHPLTLVHADFSPKNLLVSAEGLLMVDFETGHFGDPAFDLGFFLSHLVLKSCLKIPDHGRYLALTTAFAEAYDQTILPTIGPGALAALWARGIQNLAGCAWARLDGKSPVDYLGDSRRRELVREACREIFQARPATWPQVVSLITARLSEAKLMPASAAPQDRPA